MKPIPVEEGAGTARPILVFWETTRACLLACRHCRASAMADPLPGQLSRKEGREFVRSLTEFGRPYPVLVLTGGDVLMRADTFELARYATSLKIPVALAPSVTPMLTPDAVGGMRAAGIKAVSISLDGSRAATHEGIRGVDGHFERTLDAIELLRERGLVVQVNTVAMRENVEELADVAALLAALDVNVWEVFLLVGTGRAEGMEELSPAENLDLCHFLYEASRYGFVVRTVEAPFFRRVVADRNGAPPAGTGQLYGRLSARLVELLGMPRGEPKAQTKGTRDGKGIVFVGHDGDVYPAGFLPLAVGNVRRDRLARIYRESTLLRQIRAGRFTGRCGTCGYADLCGGSRARAFATSGDPLGDDPACPFRDGGREEPDRQSARHPLAACALMNATSAATSCGLPRRPKLEIAPDITPLA
ncbi:MAG: TIGR04053 family radical SAM/SPASM domain-containing protein [Verrucomicrobiota bacterium]